MSKTFRFFGCYLLSVASVLGVVGNAFGQGQEKDAKQEIVKHERVLPSVKLGKCLPGQSGTWLIVVDPKFEYDQDMECYEIGKSCTCTNVRLTGGAVVEKGKTIAIELELKASEGSGGNRLGEFYLAFRGDVEGRKKFTRVIQPFSYIMKEEIDFGSTGSTAIRVDFYDDLKPISVKFQNNTGRNWSSVFARFVGTKGEHFDLPASLEMAQNVDDGQRVELNSALAKLHLGDEEIKSVEGQLEVFVQESISNSPEVWRLVTKKQIEFRLAPRFRLFPNTVFLDDKTEEVTLRVILSRKQDDFGQITVCLRNAESGEKIHAKTSFQSNRWMNVSVAANDLSSCIGYDAELTLESNNGITDKLVIPIR